VEARGPFQNVKITAVQAKTLHGLLNQLRQKHGAQQVCYAL